MAQLGHVSQLAITIEPDRSALRAVRRFVVGASRYLQCRADTEILELVTTEVVSNAIALDAGEVTVSVRHGENGQLRVEVRDHGMGVPDLPAGDGGSDQDGDRDTEVRTGGRGMVILDRLSAAWGVEQFLPGKIVWFELAAG